MGGKRGISVILSKIKIKNYNNKKSGLRQEYTVINGQGQIACLIGQVSGRKK